MKRSHSTSSGRAPAGGQVGQNGEFYKGGTFLPNTTLPKRGASKAAKSGRGSLIEPGVYAHAPSESVKAIFHCFREFLGVDDGVAGVVDRPDAAIAYYIDSDVERGRQILQAAAEAYNRGERWYESNEQLLASAPASGHPEP